MRTVLLSFVLLLFALPSFAAEASKDLPSVTLPPELDRVLRDYEKGWQAKDAKALAALFADDGFVLSNGAPPARGRAAIEAAYAGAGGPLALRALHYSTGGSTGYIIGAFAAKKGDPDGGKFVLALKKVKGRWLIAADIDNMNSMPRGVPPPPPQ
jgi:ketosteroid isomerase-like protein